MFVYAAEVEQRDIGAESKVPMEELCQKAIEQQRQQDTITSGGYSHALSILGNLQVTWKRVAVNKKLALEIQSQELMIQNLKLQYNAHSWLHDDLLKSAVLPSPMMGMYAALSAFVDFEIVANAEGVAMVFQTTGRGMIGYS